jgi:hypothetical protein
MLEVAFLFFHAASKEAALFNNGANLASTGAKR